MFNTLFASSFGSEYMYSPLYFIQVLNHSLHVCTLGNSRMEPEEIYMHNFKQWVSNNGQSRTKIFFPEVLEESLSSHSQERHLVDHREPGYQVMTMLYSLPAENNLDQIHSFLVRIFRVASPSCSWLQNSAQKYPKVSHSKMPACQPTDFSPSKELPSSPPWHLTYRTVR